MKRATDPITRLRQVVREMKTRMRIPVPPDNSDIFGPRPTYPGEAAELQGEIETLSTLAHAEHEFYEPPEPEPEPAPIMDPQKEIRQMIREHEMDRGTHEVRSPWLAEIERQERAERGPEKDDFRQTVREYMESDAETSQQPSDGDSWHQGLEPGWHHQKKSAAPKVDTVVTREDWGLGG
jgi:hypothetical protein